MTMCPSEDLRRPGRPDIVRRGEDNVAAKLTEAQVLEMRALAATGVYTKSELAAALSCQPDLGRVRRDRAHLGPSPRGALPRGAAIVLRGRSRNGVG